MRLKYSTMGLIFAVDQLLLPMFHIGPLPFKLSYVLIAFWLVDVLLMGRLPGTEVRRRELGGILAAFLVIIACGLAGEVRMSLAVAAESHTELIRESLIFVLIALSFGLGQRAKEFRLEWLVTILFVSVGANLLVSLFAAEIPGLLNFYYSEQAARDLGVESVASIGAFQRPRGIFGNPNISMLQINVIFLFIAVGMKHDLIARPTGVKAIALIVAPVLMAVMLSSRSEFVVSIVLAVYLLGLLRTGRGAVAVVVVFGLGWMLLTALDDIAALIEQREVVLAGVRRILLPPSSLLDFDTLDRAQSILRPFILFETALERFLFSPVFGSGYATSTDFPFITEPRYYHNDWFRWIVSTGLIGTAVFGWVIARYCVPVGLIVLILFFVPGLTNSFILAIPSVMFYFFMIAVVREKIRSRRTGAEAALFGADSAVRVHV